MPRTSVTGSSRREMVQKYYTQVSTSFLYTSCVRSQITKHPKHCQPPVNIQERATTDIASHHIIPLSKIPKVFRVGAIRRIDVAKIRKAHKYEIPKSNFVMPCPATDYGDACEQQEYVTHLQGEGFRLWCESSCCNGVVWCLIGIILRSVLEHSSPGPNSALVSYDMAINCALTGGWVQSLRKAR